MKKRTGLILLLVLTALILGSCTMGPRADGAPGVSADESAAYVAYQQFVYKVDAASGSELWRYPATGSAQVAFYAPPLISDGKVFIGDLANAFHQISAENGSESWNFAQAKGWYEAKAATDGTAIIAPNLDRSVYCLNTDGTLRWAYPSKFGFLAEPVIHGDTVYISSLDHNLVALSISSGDVLWKTELTGALVSAPVYDQNSGTLFVGSIGKDVTAINSETGEILWTFNNDGQMSSVWATPALMTGNLIFSDESGKIFALNPTDGTIQWTLDAGGNVTAGILPLEDSFLVAREDGTITLFKLSDRSPVWTRTIDGEIYSTPAFAGGKIFIGVKGTTLLQAFDPNGNLIWSFTPGK